MSEAEEYDSVRVSAEGIRVLKRFAADQFPVPAIAFEISSGRDEAVTVRLSDRVPMGVAVDDLGFHPDYGSEHWTIEENRITFEREFEPDASYTTVYGIRAADDVGQFLTEPTVEEVDPPLPRNDKSDDIILESDDALVEDAISSGLTSDEPDEETTEDTEPEVPSTLDLGGPTDSTESKASDDSPGDIDGTETEPEPGPAPEPAVQGSVVTTLAAEIRNNNVPEEDLDLLREVLVDEQGSSGSTTARLDRLQRDVADLRAYTSAIEEFLDENGTGAELIDSFEDQLDEFADELSAFGDRIEHLETEFVVEVRGRIDELETEFERFESRFAEELGRLDEIDRRTDDIAERADSADARTTELVRRLDDLESDLEELDRLDEIEAQLGRLDEVESQLDRLDEIEAELSELDRLDEIEAELSELDRLDDVEAELQDIQDWRNQLISTLGG